MYGAIWLFEDEFIHIVSISFSALIVTELLMVALTVRTWHYLMVAAEVASFAIYIISMVILKDVFGGFWGRGREVCGRYGEGIVVIRGRGVQTFLVR